MSKKDLKEQLAETINELSSLLEVTEDPDQQFALRTRLHEMSASLDKLVVSELQVSPPEFNEAMDSLKKLAGEAKNVRADIKKFEKILEKSASTIARVEKLFKNISQAVT